MEIQHPASRSFLELPDACLLAVLQCLAADDDLESLTSAALSHSRLHQAAVAALSSISWAVDDEYTSSMLLYLDRHGGHVSSLELYDCHDASDLAHGYHMCAFLAQLPTSLVQLTSLDFGLLDLQLQPWAGSHGPWAGSQGVVRPCMPLRQLRLHDCMLVDGEEGLAAALSLLPGLEHLYYSADSFRPGSGLWDSPVVRFPPQVLLQLPRLTYLALECDLVQHPNQQQPALQPLQVLSRLVDLRLHLEAESHGISAEMLSNSPHLTRLDLFSIEALQPGALARKTDLEHLAVRTDDIAGGNGVARLLSHVQHMQQLTHLDCSLVADEGDPPAAAFSALTASSKLQVLRLGDCVLPAGVWRHVFPAGRQLPHLTLLQLDSITLPGSGVLAAAPEGSRLVSCCPGLQFLGMEGVGCSAAHLAQLQGLLSLHTLLLDYGPVLEGPEAVGVLTQLRELQLRRGRVELPGPGAGLLLQIAGLKQLTRLRAPLQGTYATVMESRAPGDEPVWVQILRRLARDRDPDVARQAAARLRAALAECG